MLGHVDPAQHVIFRAEVAHGTLGGKLLRRQGIHRHAFQRRHPDPVFAVIQVDLPLMRVLGLLCRAVKEKGDHQRQGNQHHKPRCDKVQEISSPAQIHHLFLFALYWYYIQFLTVYQAR